jgi:hypothetical protein
MHYATRVHFFQMGYANMMQTTAGIHVRTYSRAFVFEETEVTPAKRVAFVSVDVGMLGHLLKINVLKDLEELFPGEKKYDKISRQIDKHV